MSLSEMRALFGQGTYNATGFVTAASEANEVSRINMYHFNGNASGFWTISYNATAGQRLVTPFGSSPPGAREYVFSSNVPGRLYLATVNLDITTFNEEYNTTLKWLNMTVLVLNSTIGGMTYSYVSWLSSNSSAITPNAPITDLVGYEGAEVAEVFVSGEHIDQLRLAGMVANDMALLNKP